MQCNVNLHVHVLSNCSHCTDEVCHLACFSVSFFVFPFLLIQKKLNQKKEKNGTGIGEQERENPSKWPEKFTLKFLFPPFFSSKFPIIENIL